jgi:hypothetical protein
MTSSAASKMVSEPSSGGAERQGRRRNRHTDVNGPSPKSVRLEMDVRCAPYICPQAFYADTPIRLTANGASFTGGAVRIAIHYATVGVPSA